MNRKLKFSSTFLATSVIVVGVAVAASSPAVSTGGTSSRTSSSAVLHGTVNPNGAATGYQFQWGLTSAYGLANTVKSVGSGTKAVSVQVTAGRLIPGTRYHYRVLAVNKFGETTGADQTFRTAGHPPPGVITGPPTQVGTSFATVTGAVNPNGEITSWAFQYGLTPFYGLQTFAASIPAGSAPTIVSATLQGLAAGTTFHYRLIALHGSTVLSTGADQTFITFPSPRPVPRVRASTNPHRDSSKPYVFTTNATVDRPFAFPPQLACVGNATIRYLLGHKQVASTLAPMQPNCTFSAGVVFNHLPGHGKKNRKVHLRVLIHFRGNGYLAPSDARPESVVLG